MTIFVKLSPNSEHLLIIDKFLKTRRCPLFRGFIKIWTVFTILIISSDLDNPFL